MPKAYFLPFAWALLFWASFHPLALGPLAWASLVPLLLYAKLTSGRKAFFVAWLGGALGYGASMFWVRFTVPAGPYGMGVYCGLYVAVFVLLVRRLGPLWSPAIWVALEYVRSHLFGGFAWFLLGTTQQEAFNLIQILDLGGVWLVSALIAFVNGAIVDGRRLPRAIAGAAVLASVVYGLIRIPTIEMSEGPKITIVQPNIPQDLKIESLSDPKLAVENYQKHMALMPQAAAEKPDVIFWPEAAIYRGVLWDAVKKEWVDTGWHRRILAAAEAAGTRVVLGSLVVDERGAVDYDFTNSALEVDPGKGVGRRFDKVHLVPFAEYAPFGLRKIINGISGLKMEDMKPGTEFPVWDVAGFRYGPQICFEAVFPEISREIARKGAAFTVNISNDGWFRDSAELDQMQVMSRFRAIENRIGFVRATNTGISAFIAPTGREDAVLEVEGRRKEVGGTLTRRVSVTSSTSLYRGLGDWVAWAAVGAVIAAFGRRLIVDRRRRGA
ncbi:MAG TPA: apolipoprotein N-acyltransferase [Planctomycetota bacterium]